MEKELLTEMEAAAYLKVGRHTLKRFRRAGLIKYLRLGTKLIRYTPAQCDEFLQNSVRGATANQSAPVTTV